MDKNKIDSATTWLTKELGNFGIVLPEKRVRVMIEEIIKIFEKE